MNEAEPWVGIRAVADHLDVSIKSVRRYREAGTIPAIKLGGQWKFQLSKVNEALEPVAVDPFAQSNRSLSRKRVT